MTEADVVGLRKRYQSLDKQALANANPMLLALLKSIYVGQTDTSFQKFCNIAAMFQQPGRESDKLQCSYRADSYIVNAGNLTPHQVVFNVLASGQKTLGIVDLQRLATKCSVRGRVHSSRYERSLNMLYRTQMANVPKFNDSGTQCSREERLRLSPFLMQIQSIRLNSPGWHWRIDGCAI